MKEASSAGWQVWGVEKYAAIARDEGLSVYSSIAEAACGGHYDCVTLWHVLEHLPDLHTAIDDIRRLLAPDGTLIIAVPNAASVQARFFGRNWLHLDVPRHLYHFTAESLSRLLADHQLVARRLRRSEFEYDLMGWGASALNNLGAERNLFFNLLTGRKTKTRFFFQSVWLFVGAVVCGLAAVPVLVSGWLGKGGTLIVAARLDRPESGDAPVRIDDV